MERVGKTRGVAPYRWSLGLSLTSLSFVFFFLFLLFHSSRESPHIFRSPLCVFASALSSAPPASPSRSLFGSFPSSLSSRSFSLSSAGVFCASRLSPLYLFGLSHEGKARIESTGRSDGVRRRGRKSVWGGDASAEEERRATRRMEERCGAVKASLSLSVSCSSPRLSFVLGSGCFSSLRPDPSRLSPLSSSRCSSLCRSPTALRPPLLRAVGCHKAVAEVSPVNAMSAAFSPASSLSLSPLSAASLASFFPASVAPRRHSGERQGDFCPRVCDLSSRRKRGTKSQSSLQMVKKYLGLRAPDDPRDYLFDIRWPDQKPEIELLARKIDMTACFSPDGQAEPVTLLQVLPATIVQFLEYGKAVVSYDLPRRRRLFVKRPTLGKLQRVGATGFETATVTVRPPNEFVLGQILDVSSLLGAKRVHVRAVKKGKGFQGTVSRFGFHRGPMTHGSTHHRGPGSVGAGTDPGRVLPGTRMAGRDKAKVATVRNLRVLGFNPKQNLLIVRGSVPGWDMRTVVRVVWERWREECIEDRSRLIEKEREDRLKLVGAVKSSGVKSAKNIGPKKGGGKKKK
uniref:Large ribosomal subunit protein uL3c n=1 Tax=Toxoplasma gondii TgCATBr9 TaxID=943120 RepID=A0A2T6IPI9_TOXGO|nr:putative 50S ribosomal protein L3 [Toxoplasma gondii TgCATBr9]